MKTKRILSDKKLLISALEQEMGMKAIYTGPPRFQYKVGEHTVLRDGSLETEDENMIAKMVEKGLVEYLTETPEFKYSIDGFKGNNLVNIINTFAAREKLLNKTVEHPDTFHMDEKLVKTLNEENPHTIGEFMDILYTCGGEKATKGVKISTTGIQFPGFPDTPTYRAFADLIVKTALSRGWVKPVAKEVVNERYSFRTWLITIGMNGPEYKTARKELLSHFEGNPSYRTEEQMNRYLQRIRKPEPDFIAL